MESAELLGVGATCNSLGDEYGSAPPATPRFFCLSSMLWQEQDGRDAAGYQTPSSLHGSGEIMIILMPGFSPFSPPPLPALNI